MTAGTPRTPIATFYSASMDSELENRLANFLYQRGVPGKDRVRLYVHGGVVAVSGELPTRYAKWLCIECCRRVAGVIKVIDKMKVEPAISELPKSRHNSNCRDGWPFHRIRTSEYATNGTVAASQHPRLLVAA